MKEVDKKYIELHKDAVVVGCVLQFCDDGYRVSLFFPFLAWLRQHSFVVLLFQMMNKIIMVFLYLVQFRLTCTFLYKTEGKWRSISLFANKDDDILHN